MSRQPLVVRGVRAALTVGAALALIWFLPRLMPSTAAIERLPIQLPARHDLRHGDLIFRSGGSRESEIVRRLDPGAGYSHVGLVDLRGDEPYVLHVEPGSGAGESLVRRERLSIFLGPGRADAFTVLHLGPTERHLGAAAVAAALRYQASGVSFDDSFDLTTDREMYCTELVWRAYRDASLDLLDGDLGRPIALINRPVVRLTALLRSPHLEATLQPAAAP